MRTLGIDIGGNKIIFTLMSGKKILEWKKISTPKTREALIAAIKENTPKPEIKIIGIGVPGPLNGKRDLILNPPNLPYLRNFPLARAISKELKIKVVMENDANCFTLAEALMGAGKNAESVLGITLGTGVGGGIVFKTQNSSFKIQNYLYRGEFGAAGEIGHMTIKYDGIKCGCGARGCFEMYCSERFFLRKGISPPKAGLKDWAEYGKMLGIGIANLVNILDPGIVVLGGGIANNYNKFIKEADRVARENILSSFSKRYVKIKKAELGELAGAIGASLLTWQK